MPRLPFCLLIAALVAMTVALPVYLALQTGGFAVYVNGYDESTYLQYDFSKFVQAPTRPGQYLVTLGHERGLSGGWINAILDALVLVAFPLLGRAIFRHLGWAPRAANMGALLLVVLPMVAGTANPLIARLHDWNDRSGLVYWLNMPEMFASALVRSPEPQFSLVLLAVGVLAAVRLRAPWPVYLTLPFLYPFVALPAAFVTLAVHLRTRWPFPRASAWGPLAVAFVALSIAAWAYYNMLVAEGIRRIMIDSHLPLISFTAGLALLAYVALRRWIPEPLRFAALAIALAPLAAANQQIVSGHIPQPNNFEHYFGTFAVSAVVLFAIAHRPRLAAVALSIGGLLFAQTAYVAFKTGVAQQRAFPLTPELVRLLKDDPGHVVVNDGVLASMLSMVHPRQPSTALGFEKTYAGVAARHLPGYLCIKRQVLADHPYNEPLRGQLRWIDDGFMYGSQNVLVSHIGRKATFTKLADPHAEPSCPKGPLRLHYVFVR
jgi:hypothetical protein